MNTDYGDPAREHHDKAAGVTVPAEAVEIGPDYVVYAEIDSAADSVPAEATRAATRVLFERGWSLGDPAREDDYDNADIEAALAAAAPLIVADRDATIAHLDLQLANRKADLARLTKDRDVEEVKIHRDHEQALTADLDKALADVYRLTAERDAAVEATKQGIAAALRAEKLPVRQQWTVTDAARAKAFGEAAEIADRWTP